MIIITDFGFGNSDFKTSFRFALPRRWRRAGVLVILTVYDIIYARNTRYTDARAVDVNSEQSHVTRQFTHIVRYLLFSFTGNNTMFIYYYFFA